MLARCLGYLIIELSRISVEARDIVAHKSMFAKPISKLGHTKSDKVIYVLHRSFYQTLCVLLRCRSPTCQLEHYSFLVRQVKGPTQATPAPSEQPSPPLFEMQSAFNFFLLKRWNRCLGIIERPKKLVSMLSDSTMPKLSYPFEDPTTHDASVAITL